MTDEVSGDVARVLAALGLPAVSEAERISSGWGGTTIWRLEREDRSEALRIYPSGANEAKEREVAAMRAALAGGIPAPEIISTNPCSERPAIVTTWCPGRTLAESVGAAPWRVRTLGARMGHVQARLHRLVAPEAVRRRSPDWIAWAGEAEHTLQDELRARSLRTDALLHMDLHPDNILIEHGDVSGVVDWENVRAGDPQADVARTASILWLARQSPETPRWVRPIVRLLEAGWRQGYRRERAAGPEGDAGTPGTMALFDAWACAAMLTDLTPKVGRPGVWLRPKDIDMLHNRLAKLKRQAGV